MSTRTANKTKVKTGKPSTTGSKPAARKRSTAKPAATETQKSVTLTFNTDKKRPDTQPDSPTKGAHRFAEKGDEMLVGTLYTRKDKERALFGDRTPKGYKVTLEPIF
jgi:hypothetical protein